MNTTDQIVVIGAGVFGLSAALELSQRGYTKITVCDRFTPPVPDGSSVDISRIIRFDYGDSIYASLAKEAYDLWRTSSTWENIFSPAPFALVAGTDTSRAYVDRCAANLSDMGIEGRPLRDAARARELFPVLTGQLAGPQFSGYSNPQAGWADAELAIKRMRDLCIDSGVSFISGAQGTVTGFEQAADVRVVSVRSESGTLLRADHFIVATGAWTSGLLPMYNSNMATGQVLGFLKLDTSEMDRLERMPIYMNFERGWFCFPPHRRTGTLKMAIHGYGYTRQDRGSGLDTSTPPKRPRAKRPNFVPRDAEERLREGLREILPELSTRPLSEAAMCWYSETPTGDFIMDFHPDYPNVFLATGGSGHAFKFLPVLGKYIVDSMHRSLPRHLAEKWSFRDGHRNGPSTFKGDGSRGGPSRKELSPEERMRVDGDTPARL